MASNKDDQPMPVPCACMGPQGNDPVCPCGMRARGLVPNNNWTVEQQQELNRKLAELFGWG